MKLLKEYPVRQQVQETHGSDQLTQPVQQTHSSEQTIQRAPRSNVLDASRQARADYFELFKQDPLRQPAGGRSKRRKRTRKNRRTRRH